MFSDEIPKTMVFTHLVLSGGSMKCLTTLGCLLFHEQLGNLNNIEILVGSSAGGMICFLMALGYTIEEILVMVRIKILECNVNEQSIDSILNLTCSFGLDDGSSYTTILYQAVSDKLKKNDITFAELFLITGKKVVVAVTNITTHCSEYWGVHNHPDMSVVTAVRASISVPLIFTPIEFNGCCYVDGALLNNFPLEFVEQQYLSKTIAINIVNRGHVQLKNTSEWTFIDYIKALLNTVIDQNQDHRACHTLISVSVDEPSDGTMLCFSLEELRFLVNPDIAKQYINQGYNVAKCQHDTRLSYEDKNIT
jgi:NTE family protein